MNPIGAQPAEASARDGDRAFRHPRLALPFTILTENATVRLVAGEDFRYTLKAPGLEQWLPGFLARLDGRQTLEAALASLAENVRAPAREMTERLYAERVLVDGPACEAHTAGQFRLELQGSGRLWENLKSASARSGTTVTPALRVLCQDSLDYHTVLQFNRACLKGRSPWLWTCSGPITRAFVSPIFLPDAGPCLECLVRHFQRLSPTPEMYTQLMAHAAEGLALQPAALPLVATEILERLVRWKAEMLAQPEPHAALYRLHVLELESMEISTHRVWADAECPACSGMSV